MGHLKSTWITSEAYSFKEWYVKLNTISPRIPGCAESLIKLISKQQRSIGRCSSLCLYPTGLEMGIEEPIGRGWRDKEGVGNSKAAAERMGPPSCSLSSRQMLKAGRVVFRMQSSGFCLVPGARTECFLLSENCSYLRCFSRLENKKVPKKWLKKCYTSILCSANTCYIQYAKNNLKHTAAEIWK